MIPSAKIAFRLLPLLLAAVLLLCSGCPSSRRILRTPPKKGKADLLRMESLYFLSKVKSTRLSVKGVSLGDKTSVAISKWGKPKFKDKTSIYWTDSQGRLTLRIPNHYKVKRIDIFFAMRNGLVGDNKMLVDEKKIRDPTWRKSIFKKKGKPFSDYFSQGVSYPAHGFRLAVLNRHLPIGKKISAVFSLVPPVRK